MGRRSPQMAGFWDWFKSNPQSEPNRPMPDADLYQVLGVPPTASQDEIKSAFREQAMKFHPDRNPDDPLAEAKYTALSQAYAILGDETQRAAYDRIYAPEPPKFHGGLAPRRGGAREEAVEAPTPSKKVQKKLEPGSMIEKMFGVAKEEPVQGSLFDIMAPGQPQQPPARIPVPSTPFSGFNPSGNRIPMMPAIDVPDYNEIWGIITHYWHLEETVWPFVREVRWSPEFQKAGAIAIDALAGAHGDVAEWDIAEWFNIPVWQVDQYIKTAGRDAFYKNVMYPIFEQVTQIMDKLKPSDIPGRFFLEWDPAGRAIELIYAENIARRH